jgi:hypothetical protein
MKTARKKLVVLLALTLVRTPAAALSDADLKRYAAAFGTGDALSLCHAYADFEKAVPAAERASALERLWTMGERDALSGARSSVLGYMISRPGDAMPWSDALRGRVLLGAKDKDPLVRRMALNVLSLRGTPEVKPYLLDYLDDPSDELRELALMRVSRWPESVDIYTRYVKAHKGDPARARSLKKAEFFLDKNRKPLK